MRFRSTFVAFALFATSFATSLPAAAGYYIEQENILPNPATMQPMKGMVKSWREGRRLKQENPATNETVIIDLDKQQVVGINRGNQTYWKLDVPRYRKLAAFTLLAMGLTPNADGTVNVPDPLFVKTGQTATIEGRKAYEVKVAAQPPPGLLQAGISTSTSVWLSDAVPCTMEQRIEELRISLGDPDGKAYAGLYAQWEKLKGYPIQMVTTVSTPKGSVVSSQTLLTFREMKVPLSEFDIPKGFALVDDPITQMERMAAQAQGPAGIHAPLKGPGSSGAAPAVAPAVAPAPDPKQRKLP